MTTKESTSEEGKESYTIAGPIALQMQKFVSAAISTHMLL